MTRRRKLGRMKLHQALIVATLSLSVLVGNTSAQDSDGLKFGKGRLLKKMHNDIFGSKPKLKLPSFKKPQAATTAKKGFSLPGMAKTPTPALPTVGNRPTPINGQSAHKYKTQPIPKPYTIKGKSPIQTARKPSVSPAIKTSPAIKRSTAAKTSITPEAIQSVTRSAKKPTLAFGMLLQTQGENLVVNSVDPAGNANKSGIRKGDVIVGAGGIDFGSMYEFNEISSGLESGDQLEFVVSKSGKKAKTLIQFGDTPDVTSVAQSTSPNATAKGPERTATTRNRSGSNLSHYQIAPTNSSMHSVIESSETQAAPQKSSQQSWNYSSGRRKQQVKAIESAAVRGDTILNLPN